jgi:hypothetical protein
LRKGILTEEQKKQKCFQIMHVGKIEIVKS